MSAPWMPLYVADYLADTGHLSTTEHGAYMLLIMHYWRQGGLPSDDKVLARIARMSDREWKASRATVAAFFSADWKHPRIEIELEKSREKSERRAEAGARGGKAKALKTKDTVLANATILPEQNPADALASSSQSQSDKTSSDVLERMARKPAKAVRAKARTAIAPDQQPTIDDARPAHAAGMRGDDMRHEWQKFRDFHLSRGSLMADWSAAWRTWCGNFGKFGAPARAGPKPQQGEFMASVLSGKWRKDLDDQHSSEHQSDQSSGRTESAWGGSDRALPEPGGDDSGGPLLDLRVVGASWT